MSGQALILAGRHNTASANFQMGFFHAEKKI